MRTPQNRGRHRGFNTGNLPHALFHHGAAFCWVREFVTDQNTVFIVLVTGSSVGMTRNSGNGPWGDAAFGDLVTFVGAVSVRSGDRRSIGDQLTAIYDGIKVQVLRVDAEPAL